MAVPDNVNNNNNGDETAQPSNRRLVLCFDGTSNKFTGDETDTNIVKIYEMLDRRVPNQFHYYQPGIGSYVENQISNSSSGNAFTQMKDFIIKSMDMGFGTSFVHHVLAGYKFLMRFYQPGDKIFIFGFSRGAYTARYLAEMVFNIGLLSMGNEEMIRFAWTTFSDYQRTRGQDPKFRDFMHRFKDTFCREHLNVHFLGLFDCVNSVAQFQIPLFSSKASPYIPMPPATHIRHAVSIHERRLMFKPALFLIDPNAPVKSDIKEVYFAGNHGDVGGGWHCEGTNYLLSDIPLKWMVEEVLALPDTENVLSWQKTKINHMEQHEGQLESIIALKRVLTDLNKPKPSLRRLVHDPLAFGRGSSWFGVLSWWIIEVLPIACYELVGGKWIPKYWPPNLGSTRDIPFGAEIHSTVVQMKRAGILSEGEMPRLGGEEPYDPIKRWSFFSLFKRKEKITEPCRAEVVEEEESADEEGSSSQQNGHANGHTNGNANGYTNGYANGHANGSHKWSFDNVLESGSKTWDLI